MNAILEDAARRLADWAYMVVENKFPDTTKKPKPRKTSARSRGRKAVAT